MHKTASFAVIALVLLVDAFGFALAEEPNEEEAPLAEPIRCQIDSEDRDVCIRNAIQDMIPRLYRGHSDLNIPPIDPLVLNKTHFEYNKGPMHGILNVKTATIYGLTRTQIKDVRSKIDENGMSIEIDSYYPRILIDGYYKGEGSFNDYKLNARGYFNVTFKKVNTSVKMDGLFETNDNERYLRINAFDVKLTMEDMKVFATGIFPEPELNQLALEFVNQYWPSMYRVMIPDTKDIWEPRLIQEMNAFLLKVPIRKMLY